jgi:BRCT domain type II-containing protein
MNEYNSIKTLEFIQLVKSAVEYFGTTRPEDKSKEKIEESKDNIDEVSKMLQNMSAINLDDMGIKIPNEIDKEIRDAFLSQIRYYKKKAEDNTEI